jgi:hypothetical protein
MALTQDRLKEVLKYVPFTGSFIRALKTAPSVVVGTVAGCIRKDGYVWISVDGVQYLGHRLAFLYMTGGMPLEIDHDDRDRSNNRWLNLEAVTHAQNIANCALRKDNKVGVKGVWKLPGGSFRARIKIAGKAKHLGCFHTAEEAHQAFINAGGRF